MDEEVWFVDEGFYELPEDVQADMQTLIVDLLIEEDSDG